MNKFRKLGFISYNGKIEVHSSLLNAVLREKSEIDRKDWPPRSQIVQSVWAPLLSQRARSAVASLLRRICVCLRNTWPGETHAYAKI